MGFHSIDHCLGLLVLSAQFRAELYVGSFHLVVYRFADVMKQTGTLGQTDIQSQFPCQKAGQLCHFDRMLESILPVTGAEAHLSQKPYKLRMDSVYADFQSSRFAFLLDPGFHFSLRFTDHFFDSRGMDSSVHDQLLQSDPGHLAPDRFKSGNNNGFRRVIDDQIHACHCLERSDISALTSDDPSLHLITGKLHDRDRRLRNMICSASLNRADHIFLGSLICLFLRLRLDFFDHDSGVMSHFIFNNF